MNGFSRVVVGLLPLIGFFTLIVGIISWKNDYSKKRSFTTGNVGLFILSLGYILTEELSLFPTWLLALLSFVAYKTKRRWLPILKRWRNKKEGKTIIMEEITKESRKSDNQRDKARDIDAMLNEIWSKLILLDFWTLSVEISEIINELNETQRKELRTEERDKIEAKLAQSPEKRKRDKLDARLREIKTLEVNVVVQPLSLAISTLNSFESNRHLKHTRIFNDTKNCFKKLADEQKHIYITLMGKVTDRLAKENQKRQLLSQETAPHPPLSTEEIILKLERGIKYYSDKRELNYMTFILNKASWFFQWRLEEDKLMDEFKELSSNDTSSVSMNKKKEELNSKREELNRKKEVIKKLADEMTRTERAVYDELTQKAKSRHDFTKILMKMETDEWREQFQQEEGEQYKIKRIDEEKQRKKLQEEVETKTLKEAFEEAEEGKIDIDKIKAITQYAKMKEEKEREKERITRLAVIENERRKKEALQIQKEDEEIDKIINELPKKIYDAARKGRNYVTLMSVEIHEHFEIPKGFTEHIGKPVVLRNSSHWLKGAPKRLYDRLRKIEDVYPTLIDRSQYYEEREQSFLVGFYIGVKW